MKRIQILLAAITICAASFGQTKTNTSQAITDDDLRKYAITMDSVEAMQQTLMLIITENVQKNTVMEVARYNELRKIETDQAKLTAANAQQQEIEFLKEIADLRALNIKLINATYQALAKEYVGLKTFNAINKSLETDSALKERYNNIHQQVGSGEKASSTPPSDSKGK